MRVFATFGVEAVRGGVKSAGLGWKGWSTGSKNRWRNAEERKPQSDDGANGFFERGLQITVLS